VPIRQEFHQEFRLGVPQSAQIRRTKTFKIAADKIAELCAEMVEATDLVLSTEPWTREGSDARRLFRVLVTQIQWRANASRDPLLIAVVYDSLAKFREGCPDLFEE
jgi:hypothetical protein